RVGTHHGLSQSCAGGSVAADTAVITGMEGPDADPGRLQLKCLTHIEPLLPALPQVVYEYTIPDLTTRTRNTMRARLGRDAPAYGGNRRAQQNGAGDDERYVQLFESARLISGVYSHFLDPLRFSGEAANGLDKHAIFNSFVRTLIGPRFLPAVVSVAANIATIRRLDTYQPGVGTNAARWMQYLAYEAVHTNIARYGFMSGRDLDRLRVALYALRDSATTLDRFKALARGEAE
ncbi:MAG TPA: hypothetical protein VF221_18775, partial [Chloroflexota bacterium]